MSTPDVDKQDESGSSQVSPLDDDRDKYWQFLSAVDLEWLRSSIDADEKKMRAHVDAIRKEAFDFSHFPCIRAYLFVKVDVIGLNPIYKEVVEAGKQGDTIYLDFGCCMGTDARKLVADGYPAQNVIACDLHKELLDFGHRLYNDASTSKIHFFAVNAFDIPYPPPPSSTSTPPDSISNLSEVTNIGQMQGKATHLYAGFFFHMFNEEKQFDLALRFGSMVKHEPGAIIYGRHIGAYDAHFIDALQMYAHSPESWTRVWKKVFTELESAEFAESKVIVKAEFLEMIPKEIAVHGLPLPVLHWSIQIV